MKMIIINHYPLFIFTNITTGESNLIQTINGLKML